MMFDPGTINIRAFTYYTRLQRVKDYVDKNISDDLSLGAAARVAGLEEKYFSTFFHAKAGVRFNHWVSYQRIRRAKELLWSSNQSITNVAFAVGFQDVRTFERAFKRVTSMTPFEYKKAVRPS
jgi:transcriptional regulator GlxA family with amidase domain